MQFEFHPLANLFPLIEGAEFDALVADIEAKGLHEAIDLYQGKILDGRNRYRAASAAGIELERRNFRQFHPELYGDPLSYVISKNLNRRHLNDRQRTSIAGEIAALSRGRPRSENPPIGGISAEDAAAQLKVAPRQVERSRVVHAQGVPELRGAFRAGELPIATAEQIARLPEPEQQREVERILPRGARAIMGSRQEPGDSLDYFPTPPWATRALVEVALPHLGVDALGMLWEPACGEGHISGVLQDYARVIASDVHDYSAHGRSPPGWIGTHNFLSDEPLVAAMLGDVDAVDWIITNPPFGEKGEAFVHRALELAEIGVAMFLRMQWLETIGRYERLFSLHPPTLIAFFAERVNLCKGRWDPQGGTATAYMWLVWQRGRAPMAPFWIPPGQRERLTRADDAERFTAHPVIKRNVPTDAAGNALAHDDDGVVADDADIPAFLKREAAAEAAE